MSDITKKLLDISYYDELITSTGLKTGVVNENLLDFFDKLLKKHPYVGETLYLIAKENGLIFWPMLWVLFNLTGDKEKFKNSIDMDQSLYPFRFDHEGLSRVLFQVQYRMPTIAYFAIPNIETQHFDIRFEISDSAYFKYYVKNYSIIAESENIRHRFSNISPFTDYFYFRLKGWPLIPGLMAIYNCLSDNLEEGSKKLVPIFNIYTKLPNYLRMDASHNDFLKIFSNFSTYIKSRKECKEIQENNPIIRNYLSEYNYWDDEHEHINQVVHDAINYQVKRELYSDEGDEI